MLDIRFIRENPEAVKENIKKKFQDLAQRQQQENDEHSEQRNAGPPLQRRTSSVPTATPFPSRLAC